MSSLPPVSPPPPPPPSPPLPLLAELSNKSELKPTSCKPNSNEILSSIEISSQACGFYWHYLNKLLDFEQNEIQLISFYNHTDSIKQVGPTCGLVALGMCIRQLKIDFDFDMLLKSAKEFGFTNHGEMFSVCNMAKLVKKLYPVETEIKYKLNTKLYELVEHLSNGHPICIPYDSDANHEPALKKGFRAHWGAILGFCIAVKSHDGNKIHGEIDKNNKYIKHLLPNQSFPIHLSDLILKRAYLKVFVYAKQGQSKHLHMWEFENLCRSNLNLIQVNPNYTASYVIPDNDDIECGLSNQSLFIKPIEKQ